MSIALFVVGSSCELTVIEGYPGANPANLTYSNGVQTRVGMSR